MSEYYVGVGFRFQPTVQELLYLLQLKIRGYQLPPPPCVVLEAPLYGKNATPWEVLNKEELWQLCDMDEIDNTKKQMYVFTKLSRVSPKKFSRTAGIGTWDGQTNGKPILDYNEEKIVGSVKFLNYCVNSDCASMAKGKGYWNMHEYSLQGDSLAGIGHTDWVICRITRDETKDCKLNKVGKVKEVVPKDKDPSAQEIMGSQNLDNSQFQEFKGDDVLIMEDNQYCRGIMGSEKLCSPPFQEVERQGSEFGNGDVSTEGGHQHGELVIIPEENPTCCIENVEGFFNQCSWENNQIDYCVEIMECQEENVPHCVGSCGSNFAGADHQELVNHDVDPSELIKDLMDEHDSILAPGILQKVQEYDGHSEVIPMFSDEWFAMMTTGGEPSNPLRAEL